MSIQSAINRISTNISGALEEIELKGVDVPTGANSDNLRALIRAIQTGGGLPDGVSAIKFGTFTLDSDIQAGSSTTSSTNIRTITHGLGVVPDILLIYHLGAINVTYSELGMMWSNNDILGWRSNYPTQCWYHSNSTTTVSGGSCQSTYGIRDVTSAQFKLKCHASSNYYWRAGTYNYIAFKFS